MKFTMTKLVLLFGALATGLLLSLWLLVIALPNFRLIEALFGSRSGDNPFSQTGPAIWFWIGFLAIALIRDYVVSDRDQNVLRPFATALESATTQTSDRNVLVTRVSGSVNTRAVGVTMRDVNARTGPILWIDVSCACPWFFDIRKRNIFTQMLGWAGSAMTTGNPELDAAVVVQADDMIAMRGWLSEPTVRNNILLLFRQHNVKSVTTTHLGEGGAVLRSELTAHNPFWPAARDASAITTVLCALAQAAESGSNVGRTENQ